MSAPVPRVTDAAAMTLAIVGAGQVGQALVRALGIDAVDLGPLRAARHTEPMAMAWIEMAAKRGHGRRFGFARLRAER